MIRLEVTYGSSKKSGHDDGGHCSCAFGQYLTRIRKIWSKLVILYMILIAYRGFLNDCVLHDPLLTQHE